MHRPNPAATERVWPISFDDVLAARERIRPFLAPTPLRRYPPLDAAVGSGIGVWVKHENHNPTNAFKVRNAFSMMAALPLNATSRGVVAATRGNHGLGVAYAGSLLGIEVTICVPRGNNPEKNEAVRGFGATLVEEGRDYDESVEAAERLVRDRGLTMVHSTNDRGIIAGAATLTLEVLEEQPEIEALVISVGGGSQAVGALTVARAQARTSRVWRAGRERVRRARFVARRAPDCEDLRKYVRGRTRDAQRVRADVRRNARGTLRVRRRFGGGDRGGVADPAPNDA